MIWTRRKGLLVPSRKLQRGTFHMFPAGSTAVLNAAVVTVSGETVNAFSFGSTATAGVYFYEDGDASGREGTVRRLQNTAYSQIDVATDWIRPTDAATTTYRIYRNTWTGDTGSGVFNITTSPTSINGDRFIYVSDNTPTAGGNSINGTISIDDGTAGALDTGTYFLTADREDF